MLETEKNEKNNTVGKLKTLFKKIKNFDQLKEEVFEMKKTFQQTYEDVNSIKNRYSTITDKMKDININAKINGGVTGECSGLYGPDMDIDGGSIKLDINSARNMIYTIAEQL